MSLIAYIMLEYAGTPQKGIAFVCKVSLFRGFRILAHFSSLHEPEQNSVQTRGEEDQHSIQERVVSSSRE